MNQFVRTYEDEVKNDIVQLSDTLYHNPELADEEFKSKEAHIALLKKHRFQISDIPVAGLETAFVSVYDTGKPGLSIGYLAEYDALPEIGHGCGHNMIGAASSGAAILLSKILDQYGGKVYLFGTPAEETYGGKIPMVDHGVFDCLDVALMSHPAKLNKVSGSTLAYHPIEVEFHGKSAHAASDPEKGINALSAMNLVFAGINALRETVPDNVRIHGIIKDGGSAVNVIPDHAMGQFYVRAGNIKTANELRDRFYNIVKGAELMTGATATYNDFGYSFYDMNTNSIMSDICTKHMEEMGMEDIDRETFLVGSLDMGNVSYRIPSIHPYFDVTDGRDIAIHSAEFADATLTDYAHEQMYRMAAALALTGWELLENPELYDKIKKEFDETSKF